VKWPDGGLLLDSLVRDVHQRRGSVDIALRPPFLGRAARARARGRRFSGWRNSNFQLLRKWRGANAASKAWRDRQRARKRPITRRSPLRLLLHLAPRLPFCSLPLPFSPPRLRTTCGIGSNLAAEYKRVTRLTAVRERGIHVRERRWRRRAEGGGRRAEVKARATKGASSALRVARASGIRDTPVVFVTITV